MDEFTQEELERYKLTIQFRMARVQTLTHAAFALMEGEVQVRNGTLALEKLQEAKQFILAQYDLTKNTSLSLEDFREKSGDNIDRIDALIPYIGKEGTGTASIDQRNKMN